MYSTARSMTVPEAVADCACADVARSTNKSTMKDANSPSMPSSLKICSRAAHLRAASATDTAAVASLRLSLRSSVQFADQLD